MTLCPSALLTNLHLFVDVKPPGACMMMSQPSSTGLKNAVYYTPPLQSFLGTKARLSSILYSWRFADGSEMSFMPLQSGFRCMMTSMSCMSLIAMLSEAFLDSGCSDEYENDESNILMSLERVVFRVLVGGLIEKAN